MTACQGLGKARIELGILIKIGWWGSPKMSVPGIAPNGKPRPSLDRSGPGESKNAIFGQKLVFFCYVLQFSIIWGFPLGGPPRFFFILVAPVAHLEVESPFCNVFEESAAGSFRSRLSEPCADLLNAVHGHPETKCNISQYGGHYTPNQKKLPPPPHSHQTLKIPRGP